MSKFDMVWDYVAAQDRDELVLSFEDVEHIAGVALDHSFLMYKKEMLALGFQVRKISMKDKTVRFERV